MKYSSIVFLVAFSTTLQLAIPCHMSNVLAQTASSLAYVPTDIEAIVVARPCRILKSSDFRDLKNNGGESVNKLVGFFSRPYIKMAGVELNEIDQITYAIHIPDSELESDQEKKFSLLVIKTNDVNSTNFENITRETDASFQYKGRVYFQKKRTGFQLDQYLWVANDKTIIISNHKDGVHAAIDAGSDEPKAAPWFRYWEAWREKDITLIFNETLIGSIQKQLKDSASIPLDPKSLAEVKFAVANVELGATTRMQLNGYCQNPSKTRQVKLFCDQGLELLWQALNVQKADINSSRTAYLFAALSNLLKSAKVTANGNVVQITTSTLWDFDNIKPVLDETYFAAKRTEAASNLRQIAIGFHNFHAANNGLPNSVYVSEYGKKYSWRIAILPYIGEQEIYDQYRFNEEWNSPHNTRVTSRMPDFFRSDMDDTQTTSSSWYMLTGPKGALDTESSWHIQDLSNRDGTSKTIIAVEAKQNIHWAHPVDIALAPEDKIPSFGGYHKGGFNAMFADASIQFVDENTSPEVVWKLFTADGGESIQSSEYLSIEDK